VIYGLDPGHWVVLGAALAALAYVLWLDRREARRQRIIRRIMEG
jgi:hypothetical protein